MKTTKTTNTSANFIPTSLNELTKEFMINYIATNRPEEKGWFKSLVTQEVEIERKLRNGTVEKVKQSQTFAIVRKEFARKFFPMLIKEKELTLADMVAEW